MMESGCVEVDDQVSSDLFKIIDKNTERVNLILLRTPFGGFSGSSSSSPLRLRIKGKMCWHPMIIKWCLHL